MVGTREVLDHLIGVHHVDACVIDGKALSQVAHEHLDPGVARTPGDQVHELDSDRPSGPHALCDPCGEHPIAAAKIDQETSRPGERGAQYLRPVFLLGLQEVALQVPHGGWNLALVAAHHANQRALQRQP